MARPAKIDRARFARDLAAGATIKVLANSYGCSESTLRELAVQLRLVRSDARRGNGGESPAARDLNARGCAALLARLRRVHPRGGQTRA